ncbi:ABC transporter ATP-binding protein [Parahaliea mediterranea]|uniref:ABC transporter ATP-binding protein n=1 Tax=Parahaliea mediterranea TaxID=651086 RepID=A0A939DE36_9GAMM|nr:ABC transporter ATP-binding protein [Parahaliea mediterranea]MBN7796374.1 ABC transporter ATP-binding protein [Parahaliea mediterranea]
MTEYAIRARGISKRFGDLTAVDHLDMEVESGRIFGFLGPNGSGKTTTIRMLCGLLTPSDGDVEVLGLKVPEQAEQLRQRIGYMTQKFSLYTDLSTRENLRFMADIYGLDRRDRWRRIDEVLAQFTLTDLRDRRLDAMSGGQRQRVALAAATLHRPTLLFLDEPTSAVDPENRRDFWEKLFDLSEAGTTILVSTHYMDEAERCHRLAILERGQVRRNDAPDALMQALDGRVIEVNGPGLRQLRQHLMAQPEVVSAAQQGSSLRVLLGEPVAAPLDYLRGQLNDPAQQPRATRPNLEDVFMAATSGERAA